jgi:hypothetical protein
VFLFYRCSVRTSVGAPVILSEECCGRQEMLKESLVVRFEVFTAVTMKNGVFWDITPCGYCKNRRFGGTWRLLHQGDESVN